MASRKLRDDHSSPKRATNVSLSVALVEEARTLGIGVSQSCEDGLALAVKRARADKWLEDNRDALESNRAWVAQNGLPLARYRMF